MLFGVAPLLVPPTLAQSLSEPRISVFGGGSSLFTVGWSPGPEPGVSELWWNSPSLLSMMTPGPEPEASDMPRTSLCPCQLGPPGQCPMGAAACRSGSVLLPIY